MYVLSVVYKVGFELKMLGCKGHFKPALKRVFLCTHFHYTSSEQQHSTHTLIGTLAIERCTFTCILEHHVNNTKGTTYAYILHMTIIIQGLLPYTDAYVCMWLLILRIYVAYR